MASATGRASLVAFSPSYRLQGRIPALNLNAGTSFLWCRRGKTHLPLVCAACTLGTHAGDELVDVIGIGRRKNSIIDYCLDSPSVSASCFKFWTIFSRDEKKIQLLERCHSKDEVIRNVEFPLSPHSCQPTTILLASTGHGLDHLAAIDLLNNIKSVGGLAIAIVLKPFDFEGQRRRKEVNDLVNNLKSCLNFYVVVETDPFFVVGTLAEALECANNTVLLTMNTISSMISKKYSKILSTPEGKVKDVKPSEVVKALERHGEVKMFHGSGYNVNAAIMQAILCSSFFDSSLKDFNGLAIITLTSACNIGDSDLPQILSIFRRLTGYTRDIIFSRICDLNLKEKLAVVTLLITGHHEKLDGQGKGFFSRLLQNLGSFLHFLQVDSTEAGNTSSNSSFGDNFLPSGSVCSSDLDLTTVACPYELIPLEDEFPNVLENVILRKESFHETAGAAELLEINCMSNYEYNGENSGEMMHSGHQIDPVFHIAQLWAKKCSENRTKGNDKGDIFSLQVGIKSSKISIDCTSYYNQMLAENSNFINQEIPGGIAADISKKNSLLSVRAAMMLEAERDSPKCWNPIVEIQYRGGIYRGRCRGGLPDGKGRLTFMDGSFYEGFWKCGKKSGIGTFCYSNGDLFRGPWRDDLMHGKGWFYFHTGDRWFANFLRGKAHGEGKFFSKNGSVFIGVFRDGWRHGQCVNIETDGLRWREVWNDGVLVERAPHDKKADI